jgi:hypothetical protein
MAAAAAAAPRQYRSPPHNKFIRQLINSCKSALESVKLMDENNTIYDIDPTHFQAAVHACRILTSKLKESLAALRRSTLWRRGLLRQPAHVRESAVDPDHHMWAGIEEATEDYLSWHQMIIDYDRVLTTRFLADVNGQWHDHQPYVLFAYVLSLLNLRRQTERGDFPDSQLTVQQIIDDQPANRRLAIPESSRARPISRLRTSELLTLLQSVCRQWSGLAFSLGLERFIERLAERADQLLVVHSVEEQAHDVEKMRQLVMPDGSTPMSRTAVYAANYTMINTVHWIFRDLVYHVSLMTTYYRHELHRTKDQSEFAPTLQEYANAVDFFHRSSEILPHHDASDLLQSQLPTEALMPGEYRLFFWRYPNAFRSTGTVIEARGSGPMANASSQGDETLTQATHHPSANFVLDTAMELPQVIIKQLLPTKEHVLTFAGDPCAQRRWPAERLMLQPLQLRLALQAHLVLYMDTHYKSVQFAEKYVVGQPRYTDMHGIMQREINEPFVAQVFNHWHLVLNKELHQFDDFVAAFCGWLKVVRKYGGTREDGQIDLMPLCREVLDGVYYGATRRWGTDQ